MILNHDSSNEPEKAVVIKCIIGIWVHPLSDSVHFIALV